MTKKPNPNYIGLIHELQTHKEPFVIRPIFDRFHVNRNTTRALGSLGYITTTGVKRAMRCQWVGPKNPTLGQVQMMAKATERENRKRRKEAERGYRAKKGVTNTPIPSGTYKIPLEVKAPVADPTPTPAAVSAFRERVYEAVRQKATPKPTRPSKRVSILWGLFTWESK